MTITYDNLKIPANNLLDGREYEQRLEFVFPDDLREGDVVTNGTGTYQVGGVGDWREDGKTTPYVRHIRIQHTLAGPIMGGLLRGQSEYIHRLARRRDSEAV